MLALVLKLTLAPGLVAVATLAARHSGPQLAGLISGLPVVAAPILLVLEVQQGPGFGRAAAAGAVLGIASLVAFCVVYAACATRAHVSVALTAAVAAFLAGTALFYLVRPPLGLSILLTGAIILAAAAWLASVRPPAVTGRRRGHLLALRLIITAVLVLALTGVARGLSPHLAGLLTPFPIITSVMAGFTHHRTGAEAAVVLLSGLVQALISFLAFFAVAAVLLDRAPAAGAFAAATAATLATWGALAWWQTRGGWRFGSAVRN